MMHEYGIAYDIYMTAKRTAEEHQAERVKTIHVDVGEMAMANPEQVKFLFDAIVGDDPLFEGADLSCHQVARLARCPCGYEGKEIFVCPRCGSLPDLVRGREIVVTTIEIDLEET